MAGHDGKRDNFRHIVGMELQDSLAEGFETAGSRLNQEQDFSGPFDPAFPTKPGLHLRHDIDARRQLVRHHMLGQTLGGGRGRTEVS